jgi:hypothetical protein
MRKTIAAVATAAIVLGGFSAALVVQSPDVASAQEVTSEDQERTAPATIDEVLADLVTDGVITEQQSTQIAAALKERIGESRGHRGGFARGFQLETVAGVIGIEVDVLADALRDGQTIAEVAVDNGSSAEAVVDALVAEANAKLDQAVADEKLTAERAEEIRADAPDRIEARVNGEFEGRPGHRGHHGPGLDSGSDDANSEDTSA